jgi:cysteine/glycine-rich protein
MSESNLENSALSEANSDEVSAPSANQINDISSSSSSCPTSPSQPEFEQEQQIIENMNSLNLQPEQQQQQQKDEFINIINDNQLQSLPVNLIGSANRPVRMVTIGNRQILDNDLADLLIRKQARIQPTAPKCAKCEKSVYKAEEIRAANKTYHKLCFKCTNCNKLLEPNILSERQDSIYCKNCYAKNFGPKGYGFGAGAGILSPTDPNVSPVVVNSNTNNTNVLRSTYSTLKTNTTITTNSAIDQQNSSFIENGIIYSTTSPVSSSSSNSSNSSSAASPTGNSIFNKSNGLTERKPIVFGTSDKCARCLKAVYAAEKVNAAGKCYHKLCFTCSTCKKMLSSMNCCDNSEGSIFCKGKINIFNRK